MRHETMKTVLGLAWVGAASLGASACAPAPLPPTFTEAHSAALVDSVRVALQTFSEAGAAGEWDTVASMYSSDPSFLWLEEGKVIYRSADEVAAALEGLAAGMTDSELVWLEPSVVALGPGIAALATGFEQSFQTVGGEGFSFSGAISAVLVNGPEGWQFLRGHTSSASPGQDERGG